jgi:hypothetical protein
MSPGLFKSERRPQVAKWKEHRSPKNFGLRCLDGVFSGQILSPNTFVANPAGGSGPSPAALLGLLQEQTPRRSTPEVLTSAACARLSNPARARRRRRHSAWAFD